jgi:hypothetical protein
VAQAPAPPGTAVSGQLFQAPGRLVVSGITHRRRPPALGCLARLPQLPVGDAEVAQGPALAVPVTGLPENRQRLLAVADGLLKPPLRAA